VINSNGIPVFGKESFTALESCYEITTGSDISRSDNFLIGYAASEATLLILFP